MNTTTCTQTKTPPHPFCTTMTQASLTSSAHLPVDWGIQPDVHYHYWNEMQVQAAMVMLLQRLQGEAPVAAFCWELADWQAAAEGPLQPHKAAELMATVMARLHLRQPQIWLQVYGVATGTDVSREVTVNKHTHWWQIALGASRGSPLDCRP